MKAIQLTTALLLLSSFANPSAAQEEISAVTTTSYSRVQEVHETNNQVIDQNLNNNQLSVSLDQLEVQSQPGLSRNNLNQVSENINSQMDKNHQRWEVEVDWENNKLKRYF
ncbi:hypothetical protein [Lyngbya sp. PCC 8106]|uniref:hypothetical protein n=1 Tax=Lyngbya sp. (strain PCC 8106) TaxID=313612 RepID=UPI0000EAB768|nr:hypothetical protein [Lyngbya sp. PCC 8106]EAW36475.1 hypothetical protein L8106_11637 [Lyngbya sp. PCC 8106]